MIKRTLSLLVVAIAIYGCSKKTSPSSSAGATYSEDLTILHPYIPEETVDPGTPLTTMPAEGVNEAVITQYDITTEMEAVADIIAQRNLQKKFIDGYTVQVYSGSNREIANRAHFDVQQLALDAESQLTYVQPNYKVKVGKFYSRLEANKVYTEVRKVFPDAMLLPEKIPVD